MNTSSPRAFVSYSWDSDGHKEWVRDLATRLREDGIDVILDQWHLVPGDQLPEFMERAVRESDYVLIVCTLRYKGRSDRREGGVGYEGDIMTAEVMNSQNQRKFIPILRISPWQASAPSWLSGKYYLDLSGDPYSEPQYSDLINTLLGTRAPAPAVGAPGVRRASPSSKRQVSRSGGKDHFEPIRITGVIVDAIGKPRNNGTRGSALYKVPFRLSRRPPSDWASLFLQSWDHPTGFTSMHRPGIASVVGETVILDGTTVEEVEKYHRETLILAAKEANRKYQELMEKKRTAELREQDRLQAHRRNIEDVSGRIRFDEDEHDA